jgi:hypothetical protein
MPLQKSAQPTPLFGMVRMLLEFEEEVDGYFPNAGNSKL